MTTHTPEIAPSLDEVKQLAEEHNLIPVRHTFIDDCETPVSAFLKLRGEGPAFLLESADQGQRFGRYSFLGFNPKAVLNFSEGKLTETRNGQERELDVEVDPYSALDNYLSKYKIAPQEDLPPFAGGAVGLFSYDLVRTVEPIGEPNPDELGIPDMILMITDVLVVFDHLRHQITIMAMVDLTDEGDVEKAYESASKIVREVRGRFDRPVPHKDASKLDGRKPEPFKSNMTREQFEGIVERIIEYIRAGDAFQVVPSQRWSASCPVEPFSIYRGLRAINPSPYMYFMEFGDFSIAGASPEPLLKVSGRTAEMRPIAGTRPRADSPEEDAERARGFLKDEKERAEHVMLVDLARNDLGRVCEFGTVEITELLEVEYYSHVMHIVSEVRGMLREGVGAMDALRSILPAGTLSGAPKVRAMEIIDELEPVKRGSYGGAIGYLSYSGDLDTCIHIRTVVVKDGKAYVQAGGGTVADAKPAYEFEESQAKARAVFKAIELAVAQPDWS